MKKDKPCMTYEEKYLISELEQTKNALAAAYSSFENAFQPCQHRLADVYSAVVHDVGLYNAVAVGLHNLCKAPAQQVVAERAKSRILRFVPLQKKYVPLR